MGRISSVLDAITPIAVNTATDTEITHVVPINSFVIRMRNSSAFQWRPANASARVYSFDAGEKMESKVLLNGANYDSSSLGFIRTIGADDTVEALVTY